MRFLIVRACAVGDFVLHLPALRALAAVHPGARFTLVGYPETLSLAREFIPVEAIQSIETLPWSGLFHGFLRDVPYDAAWVWMKDPIFAENLRKSGMRDVFHANPFPSNAHAADHLLATVKLPPPELPDLWHPRSRRILLHPGSGSRSKVWPRFDELAEMLPEAEILLGPCETRPAVPNKCLENLSLMEVAQELRSSRVFVGNDSGITHLAAYWGTPTAALFGPTDPKVWGPIGRRVNILQKPSLKDISIDEVRKLL